MKSKIISAASIAVLALGLSAAPVAAQNAPAKIAVVDMQKITAEAKAAKNLQAQVQEQERVFGAEVQSKTKEFQQQEEELRRQSTLLDQAAFEKQRDDFQRRATEAERQIQAKQANIRQAIATAEQKLMQTTVEIITDIAKKQGYDLVVTSQTSILLNPALEITQPVMAALDQRLPTLKLEIPTGTAAAPAAGAARPAGQQAPARPAAQN
jgi:outer membrane protein